MWQEIRKSTISPLLRPEGPVSVRTISLLGASISSIIMLSRVNELRFSMLDLSELKERRLGVVVVVDYQDNSHSDGKGRWGRGGGGGGGGRGEGGGGQRVKGYESEQKKQNKKNKHKHIKCMQLPGTWLYGTRDNNNHKKTD